MRPMGTAAYRGKGQGKGKGRGEGRLGQGGRGRSKGGEKPMGTTAYGGKGSKGRAANGDRPVGAASCRRDHLTMASCQNPPPRLATHRLFGDPLPPGLGSNGECAIRAEYDDFEGEGEEGGQRASEGDGALGTCGVTLLLPILPFKHSHEPPCPPRERRLSNATCSRASAMPRNVGAPSKG